LERGEPILPLARAAQAHLYGAPRLWEDQRARLDTQLTATLVAPRQIESQSRRLTQGNAVTHSQIVNTYDSPVAPICQGTSQGPAAIGRKPGMIAEPAAGSIFGLHRPVGNPSDAGYGQPLVDHVQQAIGRRSTYPRPAIHALAGDLVLNEASLREALQQQGIFTVGIPKTVDPLTPSPIPDDVLRSLDEAGWHRTWTPSHVHLACACGYSRPVVESIIASLLCRGAGRLAYKGHRGAMVQTGMAVMAHNTATLARIHE
jgi:hypothetical protein